MKSDFKILISGGVHLAAVGASLDHAANEMGVSCGYVNSDLARSGPRLVRALLWRFCNRRPPRIGWYNRLLTESCTVQRPQLLLLAGNLPVYASVPKLMRKLGGRTAIWLTDDPWNPGSYTHRLLKLIAECDVVFSPRTSNLIQLEELAPGRVQYLPFGFDPRFFYSLKNETTQHTNDVFFAGGADQDRALVIKALADAGAKIGLYGDYWNRYRETKNLNLGYASPSELASLIAQSLVSLSLVRHENRDGHSMRTFELAACGAAILAEDTPEHRNIYGANAALYFSTEQELISGFQAIRQNDELRKRLSASALEICSDGKHSYSTRLQTIVELSKLNSV